MIFVLMRYQDTEALFGHNSEGLKGIKIYVLTYQADSFDWDYFFLWKVVPKETVHSDVCGLSGAIGTLCLHVVVEFLKCDFFFF